MARSIVVYVSGIDGSGKSTIAKALEQQLKKQGLPVVRLWFRFPYLVLYPLLFLARKTGLTKPYTCRGRTFTVHFFERIALPYLLLFVLDFTIHFVARIILRRLIPLILIVERGPLDSLVDVLVDVSAGEEAVNSITGRYFLGLQRRGLTLFTTADLKTIIERRPESLRDPKFLQRYKLYNAILKRLHDVIVIDTAKPLARNMLVVRTITAKLVEAYGYKGYGKLFRNPYAKALFANRLVIVASNWLIQGLFIADVAENAVRIALDAAAVLAVFALTSNPVHALFAFMAAHTINYLFNSNGTHVIRFFRKAEPKKSLESILGFLSRQDTSEVYAVVVFGSLARGEETWTSDLDVRVIRERGLRSAVAGYLLLAKLRLFALRHLIPLDGFMHPIDRFCSIVKREELEKMYVFPEDRRRELISRCKPAGEA